jgi:hypothetical protein
MRLACAGPADEDDVALLGDEAAAGHVNSVTSSVRHAFQETPRETCVFDDTKFGNRRATARGSAPKRIYKPGTGLNDISVLSKSCYGGILPPIKFSSAKCV